MRENYTTVGDSANAEILINKRNRVRAAYRHRQVYDRRRIDRNNHHIPENGSYVESIVQPMFPLSCNKNNERVSKRTGYYS